MRLPHLGFRRCLDHLAMEALGMDRGIVVTVVVEVEQVRVRIVSTLIVLKPVLILVFPLVRVVRERSACRPVGLSP